MTSQTQGGRMSPKDHMARHRPFNIHCRQSCPSSDSSSATPPFPTSFLGIPERRSRKPSASGRVFGPPLDRLLFFAETSNLPRCLLFSSEKGTYSESSGLLVVMYSNQWRNYSLVIASREANAAPISPSAGSRGFSGAPSERVPGCVAQPPARPHI